MNKKSPQTKGSKKIRRYIRRREAMEAVSRFRVAEDGTRYVIRFTSAQRLQHWLLLLSFTTLGITGLAQTFENTSVGYAVLYALGGIESARQIHHIAAFIFGVTALYHFGISIYEMFVYRRISRIWPEWSDLTNLFEMLKLNLGFSNRHPQFDRFTFEEKAEYWALIWGTIIMGATGLMQWFPIQVTSILPGWIIPVANALHRWEAILAVLAILTWHFYHTLIKTRNFSIFNGIMTIPQMEEEHPLELAYMEQAALALQRSNRWPALIEVEWKEPAEETVPAPAPEEISQKAAEEKVAVPAAEATDQKAEEEAATAVADTPVRDVQAVSAETKPEDAEPNEGMVESADKKEDQEPASSIAEDASTEETIPDAEA